MLMIIESNERPFILVFVVGNIPNVNTVVVDFDCWIVIGVGDVAVGNCVALTIVTNCESILMIMQHHG
jgi:hypothetical protein